MAKKTWPVDIDGVRHWIECQYGGVFQGRTVSVDGVPIIRTGSKLFETGTDIPFLVANHWCGVHMRTNGLRNRVDLSLDGMSVETGKPVYLLKPTPGWAWLFAAACIAIPVVSLGGAIPAVLGFCGAFACVATARDPGRNEAMNLLICVAITVAAWLLWALMIYVVLGAR